MRSLITLLLLPTLLLVGCGGGGSSGTSTASSTAAPASGSSASSATASSSASSSSTGTTAASASSSSSSSAPPPPPPPPQNTVAMIVDSGPAPLQSAHLTALNIPYISVTICAPGTSQCQTIDHISVDTGSSGLRLIASVLDSSVAAALPPQMNSNNGRPVQECLEFADGYVFGPVVSADVKVGAETAANVPIQLMGGSSFSVPKDCVSGAMGQPEEDTVQAFGANGIIGVSSLIQDCGQACAQRAQAQGYYACSSSGGNSGSCASAVEPLAQQVANPVASFATDNNGVALQLPAVGAAGAPTATGTLIFGVGTQANNTPGSDAVVLTQDNAGSITTTFQGTAYNESFIDSGSNGFFFNDSSITQCPSGNDAIAPGFFCPTSDLELSAANTGNQPDGTTGSGPVSKVSFMIGNAVSLLSGNPPPAALSDVGGTLGTSALNNSFDLGLPFFYGRTIFFALEGASTPLGMGPYYAY